MNDDARQAILTSIRTHLAASIPYDNLEEHLVHHENPLILPNIPSASNLLDQFKQSLESVDGHCIITTEVTDAVRQILTDLKSRRVAVSDRLLATDLQVDEVVVAPNAKDIFHFDVGISTAQAAIAETGTLVLDSVHERHRLVSLVPPVHIAIVDASHIYATLGETLMMLRNTEELSPAITFITGPSRTADIELTLTIGVHGPQQLYVIINPST